MHKLKLLSETGPLIQGPDELGVTTMSAKIKESDYTAIKPYLKYRQVRPPLEHSAEASLIAADGQLSVFSLMTQTKAVVCNQNAIPREKNGKTGVDWFAGRLEDPTKDKQIKEEELTAAQRQYIVEPFGNDEFLIRHFTKATKPEKTEPVFRNPPLSQYPKGMTRPLIGTRGTRTQDTTIFSEKTSYTLLPPRGNMRLFQGFEGDRSYFPVGLVFNLDLMHQKGLRYIFEKNAHSNKKQWVGISDEAPPSRVQLEALQDKLKTAGPYELMEMWNEIMLGGSKGALSALLVPGHDDSQDTATLTYRLNALNQSVFLKRKYHIDLPIVVVDGSNLPHYYSESMMIDDFMTATTAILNDDYPFLDSRDRIHEIAILRDLITTVTGESIVSNTDESYSIEERAEHNLAALKSKLEDLSLTREMVVRRIKELNLVGSAARELEYIKVSLASHAVYDLENLRALMVRAIALGHEDNFRYLLNHQKETKVEIDLNDPLTKENENNALHVAVMNAQPGMVKLLRELGVQLDKNQKGQTPLELARIFLNEAEMRNDEPMRKRYETIINDLSVKKESTLQSRAAPVSHHYKASTAVQQSLPFEGLDKKKYSAYVINKSGKSYLSIMKDPNEQKIVKMNNILPANLWSFVWHFLKPYKSIAVIFVSIALLAGFWGPFNSMLIKHIINTFWFLTQG